MRLTPLPIDSLLPSILAAFRENRNMVLTATPGAGKTTRLPPELLSLVKGKIAVLQPRRMAAVAACDRVAFERGWTVGREVGYQVRFESKVGADTRLIFMTDALLLRRLIDDPELHGFDLVVLDEFHERNLNQDLLLGCLRELQELGREVKILVMSATLDVEPLLRFLPDSAHFEVPGTVHPLEIRHSREALSLRTNFEFYGRVVHAIEGAAEETSGDILAFLPGTGEISRVARELEARGLRRELVPLHGSLSLADQRAALAPPQSPRVILATNVAEASVTVQGVDFVIDTGLAKVMEMNANSGFSALELKRIALFNAHQRAGRAARQKAGVCLRLWTTFEETTQAEAFPPECQRVDLSSALLLLSHLGVTDFGRFAWLDAPPGPLLGQALKYLRAVAALDRDGRLTEFGRKLLGFPLPPRWGALVAASEGLGVGRQGARAAALLNERDFADRPITTRDECDLTHRMDVLAEMDRGGRPGSVNARQAATVLEGARQLARMIKPGAAGDAVSLRRALLLSQADRLCRRRGDGERGLMVGGRGVRLQPDSQVRESEFFVALQGIDFPGKPETSVSMACGMSKAFVLEQLKSEIEVREEIDFVEDKGAFFAKRVRMFRDLPLEEPTLTPVDPSKVADQMVGILTRKWEWVISQSEALRMWMERWNFLKRHAGERMAEAVLTTEHIRQVIEMAAFGKAKLADVLAENWVGFLRTVLGANTMKLIDEQVPEKLIAPSGQAHAIQYGEIHSAYVEVRLQEIFGLTSSPHLAFGKVPLTFRLLAPNFRPVAVTSDLASFWRSAYVEVRKELRTRYPKHSWPEDPLTAKPEAKGRGHRPR